MKKMLAAGLIILMVIAQLSTFALTAIADYEACDYYNDGQHRLVLYSKTYGCYAQSNGYCTRTWLQVSKCKCGKISEITGSTANHHVTGSNCPG